jgi:glycosyltransferase involved in cell wall biosynthesis
MQSAVVVPAYDAEPAIEGVVSGLQAVWPDRGAIVVVDDGSRDATAAIAERAGARVIRHEYNRGKGAALRTGLWAAKEMGYVAAVTVDADGQHPPAEALRMHRCCDDLDALVIGVRDLLAAGAPRNSQLSNRFSNLVLSGFTGLWLSDTQCGLRRYPIEATLALAGHEDGYGYEAEVILRAAFNGLPIVEIPVDVYYPPPEERITHFDSVRDPTKIVWRVVRTVLSTRSRWALDKLGLLPATVDAARYR